MDRDSSQMAAKFIWWKARMVLGIGRASYPKELLGNPIPYPGRKI